MSSRLALLLLAGLGVAAAPSLSLAAPAKKAKPAKDPADEDAPPPPAPAPASTPTAAAPATPAPAPPPPADTKPRDMEGTDENPTLPAEFDAPPPIVDRVTKKPAPTGYPIAEVARPLTLHRFQTELGLDTRNVVSPFVNGFTLRGRFGITPKVQVALAYNIGGIYDDGGGSTTFNTGKAVALGATVALQSWLAASISIPMYLEPFAASVTLGAPMKFRFGDRIAMVLAEDVIDVRLTEFVPSLSDEAANEAQAARIGTNTTTSKGNLRFGGAAFYQYKPDLAFMGRLAISFIDFKSIDIGYFLKAGAQLTVRKNLDVAALLGFDDLEEADKTLGLTLSAQIRL